MKFILPTHTCFDDALDMLSDAVKADPSAAHSDELKLVHGICLMPDGREYSHAWVESFGRIAWFTGILNGERQQFAVHVEEYYAEMRVQETTKYTPRQAWAENYLHNNYGPWTEKYRKLCR